MREKLIAAGVKNLKEWGYPEVTAETILTDIIYSGFFKSMLEDNIGHSLEIDKVINELIEEINKNK